MSTKKPAKKNSGLPLSKDVRKRVAVAKLTGKTYSQISEELGITRASIAKILQSDETQKYIAALRTKNGEKLERIYTLVLDTCIRDLMCVTDPREARVQRRAAMKILTMSDERGGPGRGGGNPALMGAGGEITTAGGFTIRELLMATRTTTVEGNG